MTISLSTNQISFFYDNNDNNQLYLKDSIFGGYYKCTGLGGLILTNLTFDFAVISLNENRECTKVSRPQPTAQNSQEMEIFIRNLLEIHKSYTLAINAIGTRLGWESPIHTPEGLAKAFTQWLKNSKNSKVIEETELDFSNLKLTELPPQMALFKKLQKLDLSGNNLRLLPPTLQNLPLIQLNISGNNRLQPNIPSWIGSKPHLKLIAYDIGLKILPEGIGSDQIECGKYLPFSSDQDNLDKYLIKTA